MRNNDVLDVDLKKAVNASDIAKPYRCSNYLYQLVELSKTYDVIIDNGKVILSEKS